MKVFILGVPLGENSPQASSCPSDLIAIFRFLFMEALFYLGSPVLDSKTNKQTKKAAFPTLHDGCVGQ